MARNFKPSHAGTYTFTWPLRERQTNDNGGFSLVTVGRQHVTIELNVDMSALAEFMAMRAAASKRGISRLQDGMVVSRVLTVKVQRDDSQQPEGGR